MTESGPEISEHFMSNQLCLNPDSTAASKFITSEKIEDKREMVFTIEELCVMSSFFFELIYDCRSTFDASQNVSIP